MASNNPGYYTQQDREPFLNRKAVLTVVVALAVVLLIHLGPIWYLDNAYGKITPGMSRDQVRKILWLCHERDSEVYSDYAPPKGTGVTAYHYRPLPTYKLKLRGGYTRTQMYIVYDAQQRVVTVDPIFKHKIW